MSEQGYTNTKRKRVRQEREKSRFQKIAAWLIFLVALLATLTGVWVLLTRDGSGTDKTQDKYPYGTPDSLTQLENFRAAYLEANLPLGVKNKLRSIQVSGRINVEGSSQKFSLVRKRPDSMRFTLMHDSNKMTVGSHDNVVWQRLSNLQQDDRVEILEGPDAAPWREQAVFFDVIIRCFNGDGKINRLELGTHEGRDYLIAHITTEGDVANIRIWLDPMTLYPSFQRDYTVDGEVKETRFSDYRRVSGIAVPFHIEYLIDNALVSQVMIESAAINVGVPTSVFEMPQS